MSAPRTPSTRRTFLKSTAIATSALALPAVLRGTGVSPSEKLHVAFIGVGGRGRANLDGLTKGNDVVALCDVDQKRASEGYAKFPDAPRFRDFRKMFDELEKSIDVVAVSTPDHTHAVACLAALKRKKHVYCEKPLAHSVAEGRALARAAREAGVVTQLGNQGHSSGSIRSLVEWVRDGAIGAVHTIHAACSAEHSTIRALPRRSEKPPVPSTLDWDLWLGPAANRNYHPMYLPGHWRAWRPFGNGTIGDWVCHVVDPSFWALELGAPSSIEFLDSTEFDPVKHRDTFAKGDRLRFEFPARGERGPVTLYWYSGTYRIPRPEGTDRDPPRTGALLVGEKGMIQHGSHGAGGVRLVPEAANREYSRPEKSLPRVRGHHADFLDAIRQGTRAGCDFHDYGAPLSELAMLGIIAMNFPGQKLEWDGEAGRFTSLEEANAFLDPPARPGWEI